MGYRLIKPRKGGIVSKEYIHISSSRISFTKALYTRLGLTQRKKCALMYEDTETHTLCFDFKDYPFRDAFLVSVFTNGNNSTSVCIFCKGTIDALGLVKGRYEATEQDGTITKTNIKVNHNEL